MTLYGPNGQRIVRSEKYGGFTYIPDSEVVRGSGQVKERIRRRIDYYEKLLRTIDHPAVGMAVKGFGSNQIKSAKHVCNNNLDTYYRILEGLE